MKSNKLIYLSSPYSKYKHGKVRAYTDVAIKAAKLMDQGHKIFCPITHTHSISLFSKNRMDGEFWLDQDFTILDKCDELWVYQMDGWDISYGVGEEIKYAQERGIPVTYIKD